MHIFNFSLQSYEKFLKKANISAKKCEKNAIFSKKPLFFGFFYLFLVVFGFFFVPLQSQRKNNSLNRIE